MLHVKTPEEVLALIESEFDLVAGVELVSLTAAMGRVLAEDIAATEYVPDFDRSTVERSKSGTYSVAAISSASTRPMAPVRETSSVAATGANSVSIKARTSSGVFTWSIVIPHK